MVKNMVFIKYICTKKNLNGTGRKLYNNNNRTIPLTRNIIFGDDS